MRKTDKKIEKALIQALTGVCDASIERFEGFVWLTHFVDYNDFPRSLSIVCVFETNRQLSAFLDGGLDKIQHEILKFQLSEMGVVIKDMGSHVRYDTEENCEKEHEGKWRLRFK